MTEAADVKVNIWSAASKSPDFSLAYRTWFLGLMVAIYTCSFIDRIILNVVGPAIIRDLRLSDLQFGLLGGLAFAVFYSAFGIPIGRIADRRSRVTVISVCIAIWSAMTALCGVANGYGQLLLFRMGVGVGEAGSGPSSHSLISDHYPAKKRASALAVYFSGAALGTILGAVGGGWIAQTFNWRTAFMLVGLPGLALAALTRLTLKEPPRGYSEAASGANAAPPLTTVCKWLLARPTFVNLCAGCLVTNLTTSGILTFSPTFLARTFHLGLAQVGLIFGLSAGCAALIGFLLGGFGADRTAKRDLRWYGWLPALGLILALPLFYLAFASESLLESSVLIFLGSLLSQFYFAPTFAMVQNLVEPRMRATAAAITLLLMNIVGQGLGPTLIGFLSDRYAGHFFTQGDYASVCRSGVAHLPLAAACAHASAAGLSRALQICSVFLVWGALHYLMAARTMARDVGRA